MTSSVEDPPLKLPAWRLVAALLILGGMAFVLLSLAPVYLKDLRFQQSIKAFAAQPALVTMTDEAIRAEVMNRAAAFGLPVLAGNVHVARDGRNVKVQLKYAVHFELYQVDLHFHANAEGRGQAAGPVS